MKKITTTLFILGFALSLSVNAQTKTEQTEQIIKVKESSEGTVIKIKQLDAVPAKGNKAVIIGSSAKNTRKPIRSSAKVSDYFGLEKEIIKRTLSGKIPVDLPKHKNGQTKEAYIQILKKWAKNNLHLLKKEFHTEY